MMPGDVEVRCTLRIPKELRDRVAEAAEINSRSLNGEMLFRLDDYDRLVDLLKRELGNAADTLSMATSDEGGRDKAVLREMNRSIAKLAVASESAIETAKRHEGQIAQVAGEVALIRKLLEPLAERNPPRSGGG